MDQDEAMFGSEPKKKTNLTKWFALGVGGLVGLSHIGMIGMVANRKDGVPKLDIPVGPYTSYVVQACLLYTSPSPRDS